MQIGALQMLPEPRVELAADANVPKHALELAGEIEAAGRLQSGKSWDIILHVLHTGQKITRDIP